MQTFSAFDPILIRMNRMDEWAVDFYDRPHHECDEHWTITGSLITDKNILPYNEETKHLHGTIGEFVKWKPKEGEPILVKDIGTHFWLLRIFLGMRDGKYVCSSDPDISFDAVSASWDCAKPYINKYQQ